jgi:hypothetical protein
MKKSLTDNSNPFSPNLNLRSRKIIRKTNEPLKSFTADLNSTLNDVVVAGSCVSPLIAVRSHDESDDYDFMQSFDFECMSDSAEIDVVENNSLTSQDEFEIVREQINLDVNQRPLSPSSWTLTKTNKGSYKVVSCGYAFTVDNPKATEVPTASTIYWKCELHKNCTGRAISTSAAIVTYQKKHTLET